MERANVRTDGGVPTTTDLHGQAAVASGGTDGIGRPTATKLAEHGARTVLVGSTPERGRSAVNRTVVETDNERVEYSTGVHAPEQTPEGERPNGRKPLERVAVERGSRGVRRR